MTGLVFDLDGTLVDSLPGLEAILSYVLQQEGRRPVSRAEVRQMIGDGSRMLMDRALAATGPMPEEAVCARIHEDFLCGLLADPVGATRLFPGLGEVLEGLRSRGIPMSICTNKPLAPTHALLEGLGISGYFRGVVAGDSLPTRKPAPEMVLAAQALLGIDQAWMVGDSEVDLRAGRAAGLPVALVDWGYAHDPIEELGADVVIRTAQGLFSLVDRPDSPPGRLPPG